MDGGTLEYIFETDEQDVPKTVSKERALPLILSRSRVGFTADRELLAGAGFPILRVDPDIIRIQGCLRSAQY
jgi:hypothetical protein